MLTLGTQVAGVQTATSRSQKIERPIYRSPHLFFYGQIARQRLNQSPVFFHIGLRHVRNWFPCSDVFIANSCQKMGLKIDY